jgi:hypothetical protein
MSVRAKARQNALVIVVNTALERRLITLECRPFEPTAFELMIGPYPSIAHVRDCGFDEVAIKLICCPTDLGRKAVGTAIMCRWQPFGQALANAWLERRTGKYLQTTMGYYGTKFITSGLAALSVTPHGYDLQPSEHDYDFSKEMRAALGVRRS